MRGAVLEVDVVEACRLVWVLCLPISLMGEDSRMVGEVGEQSSERHYLVYEGTRSASDDKPSV